MIPPTSTYITNICKCDICIRKTKLKRSKFTLDYKTETNHFSYFMKSERKK